MNTLKTFEKATVAVKTGRPVGHVHYTINKTWGELTDSEKQTIASDWIKDHVSTNVNQVMQLLAETPDHDDHEEYLQIAEARNYEEVSEDHINDLSIDELIEVIEEYDLESDIDHIELFKTKYLKDLIENTENTVLNNDNVFYELDSTFLTAIEEDQATSEKLVQFFKDCFNNPTNDSLSFDDLETCTTNLSINFDGYLKSFQSDLVNLIIDNIDLEQYGQDNNLDPEYNEAYEFWAVSNHFKIMLQNELSISDDILGITVWARYTTGQSICLDHAVQVAAFKALSDCHYDHY